ncbi:hypothetical protein [Rhizobium sp.]|uniref:hypothetical protein n=1 Tax=Rhizobium sp. TaxID=391 RepID=UPI0028AF7B5A
MNYRGHETRPNFAIDIGFDLSVLYDLVDPEQRQLMDGILSFDPKLHGIADFRSLMEGLGSLLTPEPVDYELRQAPRWMAKVPFAFFFIGPRATTL